MMMVSVIALHPCNRSPGPRDKGAAFPRACKSAPKTILWENPRRLRRGAEAIGRWYTPVSILARGTEGSNPPYSSSESVSRGTLSSWVKNPGFRRRCAGRRSRRGRQRAVGAANIAPTCGNICVGLYSSTPFPAMRLRRVVGLKPQGWSPNEIGLPLGSGDLASSDPAQAKPSAVR